VACHNSPYNLISYLQKVCLLSEMAKRLSASAIHYVTIRKISGQEDITSLSCISTRFSLDSQVFFQASFLLSCFFHLSLFILSGLSWAGQYPSFVHVVYVGGLVQDVHACGHGLRAPRSLSARHLLTSRCSNGPAGRPRGQMRRLLRHTLGHAEHGPIAI